MDYRMPWRSVEPLNSQWHGHLFEFVEYVTVNIQNAWRWDEPEVADEMTAALTPSQLALWAILNADGQVCNGGFSQFFFNSYGELAEEALNGFHMFGMTECADIFEQAYAAFPVRPIPKSREHRVLLLDDMSKASGAEVADTPHDSDVPEFLASYSAMAKATASQWDALESRYYKFISRDDRTGQYNVAFFRGLVRYIEAHPEEFFLPKSN